MEIIFILSVIVNPKRIIVNKANYRLWQNRQAPYIYEHGRWETATCDH